MPFEKKKTVLLFRPVAGFLLYMLHLFKKYLTQKPVTDNVEIYFTILLWKCIMFHAILERIVFLVPRT
jgi:hypothetical protein